MGNYFISDKFFSARGFCFGLFLLISLIVICSFCFLAAPDAKISKLIPDKISYSETQRAYAAKEATKESPDWQIIGKNSVLATSPPIIITPQVLGALTAGSNFTETDLREEITEYIVEPGDNLSSIAARFDISLNTILWANNLNKNSEASALRIGQKLIILPISGVIHYVEKGDTISEIVETYKGDINKTLNFNGLSGKDNIFVGDILIIPDGALPSRKIYAPSYTPLASSYFICPIALPCRITKGLHWYNAIDFSHKGQSCGEPIFAAAEGAVQKTGYTSLGGKFVRILHPNGVVTYYGHLRDILVNPGQKVSQGAIIGYMGCTGYTIPAGPAGCHLHFDVRGARNPFAQ